MSKHIVHCWEDGPRTDDDVGTTCMLLDGHEGPHAWTRDDEISISFQPKKEDEAMTESPQATAREINELLRILNDDYDFQCEAGPLRKCVEWIALRREIAATLSTPAPRPQEGEAAELLERLKAWGENCPDPDYFGGDMLIALLADCRQAAARLDALEGEVAYWQKDSAAAWDKCEERRKEAEDADSRRSSSPA